MNIIQETTNHISFSDVLKILISIAIPLIVVAVNNWIQKNRELKKEKNRLLDIKQFIIYALESIKGPLLESSKYLKELSSVIKDPKNRIPEKPVLSKLHTSFIDSIYPQDIYKSIYILPNKTSEDRNINYSRFNNAIQFIKNLSLVINENFDNYFLDRRRYENIWNDSLRRVFDIKNECVQLNKINNIKPTDDPLVKSIDSLTHQWPKIREDGNIFKSHEMFFIALQNICKEFNCDPRIQTFDRPLSDANGAIDNLKEITKLYSDFYRELSESIKTILNNIDSVLKYLN